MYAVNVRPIQFGDKTAWRALYKGYADFYDTPQTDEMAETVWSWLFDETHVMEGLVAERGAVLIGLAHFRETPRPLRATHIGFLDDLYVDPAHRGSGAGDALFDRLRAISEDRGWGLTRWLTADDNYRARGLYDRIGRKTAWNLYEMD